VVIECTVVDGVARVWLRRAVAADAMVRCVNALAGRS
jgi:hypothetical protein